MKKMMQSLKRDEGYALGLVLIFVLGVGAVLGSVMMVTQLSADAQGRGVDQLISANNSSAATADVLKVYTEAASENYAVQMAQGAPNCGLPEHVDGTSVTCTVIPSADPTHAQIDKVFFTSSRGKVTERDFAITQDPTLGSQRVSQAGN
jgi:ABC-type Na+ efflux pump permease subunit